MVNAPVQVQKLTLDEFLRQYEREPFELIDGERVKCVPPVSLHGKISKKLVRALTILEDQGQGEVYYEQPFVLMDTPNWVTGSRVPDVMFFLADRLADYRKNTPDHENKPFILVPDLAIEIVSKNDQYSEVDAKVNRYLTDGVKLVWVVDPRRKTVIVHTYGSPQQTRLTTTDSLSGGDMLPGFALAIETLFE